jgi:5-formyltetrahydrofolate cyclo-ligase
VPVAFSPLALCLCIDYGLDSVDAVKTKNAIRKEIWSLLQKRKVARFPGATGRIPNFIGAEACARVLAASAWWKNARVVKCNPDSPQRALRPPARWRTER